jgi:hypothetical protein
VIEERRQFISILTETGLMMREGDHTGCFPAPPVTTNRRIPVARRGGAGSRGSSLQVPRNVIELERHLGGSMTNFWPCSVGKIPLDQIGMFRADEIKAEENAVFSLS